jgi:hypothetical protein
LSKAVRGARQWPRAVFGPVADLNSIVGARL